MTVTQFAYCERCDRRRELVMTEGGAYACHACGSVDRLRGLPMKVNHGPFLVFLNRKLMEQNNLSPNRTDVKAHIYEDCRSATDPVPIVWSFLVEDYPHIGMCSYCLDSVREERRIRVKP